MQVLSPPQRLDDRGGVATSTPFVLVGEKAGSGPTTSVQLLTELLPTTLPVSAVGTYTHTQSEKAPMLSRCSLIHQRGASERPLVMWGQPDLAAKVLVPPPWTR